MARASANLILSQTLVANFVFTSTSVPATPQNIAGHSFPNLLSVLPLQRTECLKAMKNKTKNTTFKIKDVERLCGQRLDEIGREECGKTRKDLL